jgi:POT family proton-dependent oligopeptide transporter
VYILISAGEIFSYVTGLEYAYGHSPKDMKVIVQAISLLTGGIGSTVALALTPIAQDPNLVIFYASITSGMLAITVFFAVSFRKYDKSRASLDTHKSTENSLKDVERSDGLQGNQNGEWRRPFEELNVLHASR